MNVFLQQISPDSEAFRSRIASGQRFTFGGSELSNRRIQADWPIPDVCAVLEVNDGSCSLINTAPGVVPVNVNWQPIQENVLKNGDTIQIGPAVFTVTWKEAGPAVRNERPQDPGKQYRQQMTASGLHQYGPSDDNWTLPEIIQLLSRRLSPILMVNAKAANIRFRDALRSLPDLYEHAPRDIRKSHSLHAITGYPANELLKVWSAFQGRDAAVWAFVDGDTAAALKAARLYLGWFAHPGSLQLHLQQGSDVLLDGLMKPFTAICLQQNTATDWALYTKPETMWAALGFDKAPSPQE